MRNKQALALVLTVWFSGCGKETPAHTVEIQPTPKHTVEIQPTDTHATILSKAARLVPTANQYAYKKLEYSAFVHFGVNTFTRKEWGDGFENPRVFQLRSLDTDQWCRTAKAAGMKLIMLTAKHHDGFVLWQSRYTTHGVMSSPYKGGKGDVLRELSKSCKKHGLKLGVYLSPADLYQIESDNGLYGNLSKHRERVIPRPVQGRPFADTRTFRFVVDDYNEYFLNQLFELLTEYGPIYEVWFDGAHPKRKGGQKYNYTAWKKLIRTLAPEAVIFGKGDVRWCGNESGATRNSEWDVVAFAQDPNDMQMFPDMRGQPGSEQALYKGKYLHYLPGEVDTSIREGWFYRDEDRQKVRSADDVFDIYERSVGGNINFLLNIPPNREGRFSDEDVRVLTEVGTRIRDTYGSGLLANAHGASALLDDDEDSYVSAKGGRASYEIAVPQAITLNRFVLQEAIHKRGQRIAKHALDIWQNGKWRQVATATTVGYKRILRFPEVTTDRLRLRILEARDDPSLSAVSAHYYAPRPPQLVIARDLVGRVTIRPKQSDFSWKTGGIDVNRALNNRAAIRYTTDGSEPTSKSTRYAAPFLLTAGKVKARAFDKGQVGSLTATEFGIVKAGWTAVGDSGDPAHRTEYAIDADPMTFWSSGKGAPSLTVDLHKPRVLTGLVYTPPAQSKQGLIERGSVGVSKDGKSWRQVAILDHGNLINDPTPRTTYFDQRTEARYVRVSLIRGAGGSTSAAIAELDLLAQL